MSLVSPRWLWSARDSPERLRGFTIMRTNWSETLGSLMAQHLRQLSQDSYVFAYKGHTLSWHGTKLPDDRRKYDPTMTWNYNNILIVISRTLSFSFFIYFGISNTMEQSKAYIEARIAPLRIQGVPELNVKPKWVTGLIVSITRKIRQKIYPKK